MHTQEADWAREFLISLQNMFSAKLPKGMAPQQQSSSQGALSPTGGESGTNSGALLLLSPRTNALSSLKSVNYPYCSALLQVNLLLLPV